MMNEHLLILLLVFFSCIYGFPKKVFIGGLFDQDETLQWTFESSAKTVNNERYDNEELSSVYLTPEPHKIGTDLFEVSMKGQNSGDFVCELVEDGIVGIFGPQEKTTADHVQSMCDIMEMPYISVRQDINQLSKPRGVGLNLYPHVSSLSRLFDQIVTEFEWKSFAILYENTESLIRMHLLLERWNPQGNSISVYHLGHGPSYREAMQNIKTSKIENIIIDCSYDILDEVLKQAQQVDILSNRHRVIVTSLDLQSLDLEPYQYSGVNFTGVRLIDPKDPTVRETVNKYKYDWGLDNPSQLRVEPALMYDAVQLFARAFKQLNDATKGNVGKMLCDNNVRWEHGLSLSNFMRSTETKGLTGLVKFDRDGFRRNIQLDVVRLTKNGLKKIGVWNSTTGIDWIPEINTKKSNIELSVQNKTFTVLISLTEPYGMQKQSWTTLFGNERYEGFSVDIIEHISKILGFNYTFQVESDYGDTNNVTGKWSGMLGKILADEADLAITDLTISAKRESAVDFSMPFMNLKATKNPPSFFSFLAPFSNDVWVYLIGAYILVSLSLFVIGRLCPAEWNIPYRCIGEAEELQNQFSFKNAFWFVTGAIMQQGSEIAPIGISTRMLAGLWSFFCLIMVSSYTANLAACLTIESATSPFNNVEELARQKTIKYGAKFKGTTITFFKESNYSTYKGMYEYMMANAKDVLVVDNDAGVEKVLRENYAFLMESSSIEFIMERKCNVTKIGDLLDEKSYGIAMKKNSRFRHAINTAILKLQESGMISQLKKKWWTQKRGGGKCREEEGQSQAEKLDLDNVGGVFLVLTMGVILSCLYTICELLWDIARTSIRENITFKQILINELNFIAKCSSSKSTRMRNGSSSKSSDNSTRDCTPPYGFVPAVMTTSPTDEK